MDSDDQWVMSAVKIEIDFAEEPPVSCKMEKDEQTGQWRARLFLFVFSFFSSSFASLHGLDVLFKSVINFKTD